MARLSSNRRPGNDEFGRRTVEAQVALAAAPRGLAERVLITLSGIRQPIVAVLLLMSFFTVISGKPLDGLLLVIVATALAWDAGMAPRRAAAQRAATLPVPAPRPDATSAARPDQAVDGLALAEPSARVLAQPAAPGEPAEARPATPGVWRLRSGPPPLRRVAIGSALAVIYALTVGSFSRYSWPATAGVVGLGASVVVVGWGGPTRRRQIPGKFPRIAAMTWGSLLVAAGVWELIALFEQPNIETSSYAHPTISTLTDPLLSSAPGRSVALLGWIALGAYLVER
jgi:hypothetical protein